MSTAQPDHSRPDPLVRVQVTETVKQLNSRDQIDLSDVVDGWRPAAESFFG